MTDAQSPTHDSVGLRYEATQAAPATEAQLLGLCLRNSTAFPEALALGVTGAWFASSYNRRTWEVMAQQGDRGIIPDEATMTDELARDVGEGRTWADFSGMAQHVRHLCTRKVSRKRLDSYVNRLREEAERRLLIEAARMVILHANDEGPTSEMRSVLAEAMDGSMDGAGQLDPPTMLDIVTDAAVRAMEQAKGERAENIVSTGLNALDSRFKMRFGDMVFVGARPSMGKTHFLLSILAHVARHVCPVEVFSVEMSSDAVGDRLFGHHAKEGWERDPRLCEVATPSALERWAGPDGSLPVYVEDRRSALQRIEGQMYVANARRGVRVFVVDYLQLVQVTGAASTRNREQEVAHISRSFKRIAKRLNVLVICAVQLNRRLEDRADKRPILSDLRDSGQLEQDADGVLFLYREAVYNDEADPGDLEIGIGKQRNGARGITVEARYVPGDGYVRDKTYAESYVNETGWR